MRCAYFLAGSIGTSARPPTRYLLPCSAAKVFLNVEHSATPITLNRTCCFALPCTQIHFAVDVATPGWAGLGISNTGGMTGADVSVDSSALVSLLVWRGHVTRLRVLPSCRWGRVLCASPRPCVHLCFSRSRARSPALILLSCRSCRSPDHGGLGEHLGRAAHARPLRPGMQFLACGLGLV